MNKWFIKALRLCGGLETHPTIKWWVEDPPYGNAARVTVGKNAHPITEFVIASHAVSTAWQSPKIIFNE